MSDDIKNIRDHAKGWVNSQKRDAGDKNSDTIDRFDFASWRQSERMDIEQLRIIRISLARYFIDACSIIAVPGDVFTLMRSLIDGTSIWDCLEKHRIRIVVPVEREFNSDWDALFCLLWLCAREGSQDAVRKAYVLNMQCDAPEPIRRQIITTTAGYMKQLQVITIADENADGVGSDKTPATDQGSNTEYDGATANLLPDTTGQPSTSPSSDDEVVLSETSSGGESKWIELPRFEVRVIKALSADETKELMDPMFDPLGEHSRSRLRRYPNLLEPLPLLGASDMESLRSNLMASFPWFQDVIDEIVDSQQLRWMGHFTWTKLPPILLVGSPGCGKTSFAKALAHQANLPLWNISGAGRSGAVELIGASSAYTRAHSGAAVVALNETKCANPIVFVDEVDKFSRDTRFGDPFNALATLVEEHTAENYHDDFLQMPVDLSHISWIMTANALEPLQGPLLDRVQIFRIPRPDATHLDAILAGIRLELAERNGLEESMLPHLPDQTTGEFVKAFSSGTSMRRLKEAYRKSLLLQMRHTRH